MRYRKLRIAWSVMWGLAAALLIVLWVRSYYQRDSVWEASAGPSTTRRTDLQSWRGRVLIMNNWTRAPSPLARAHKWTWTATPADEYERELANFKLTSPGFALLTIEPTEWEAYVPHWSLALIALTLTLVPWIRQLSWRFSLRTLLISTTLVAVVLGLIVWLLR